MQSDDEFEKPGETQRTFTVNTESDAFVISFHNRVILRKIVGFLCKHFSLRKNR